MPLHDSKYVVYVSWDPGICMDDNFLLWLLYICDFNCFIFR